jgi:hypothetical protein
MQRIWLADSGRNPIGPRIRPKVLVERPVLLHDHDDMLDVVDAVDRQSGRLWDGA